tara:strand:- start:484 stop:750 length:267 start_codon:yes stop_codon:yes gene_type:complete
MNDKIIECKICNNKMKEYESNNPQPLLENFDDRVCRDCNDFVTASRICLPNIHHIHTPQHLCDVIVAIMRTAYSFRKGRERWIKEEEE